MFIIDIVPKNDFVKLPLPNVSIVLNFEKTKNDTKYIYNVY